MCAVLIAVCMQRAAAIIGKGGGKAGAGRRRRPPPYWYSCSLASQLPLTRVMVETSDCMQACISAQLSVSRVCRAANPHARRPSTPLPAHSPPPAGSNVCYQFWELTWSVAHFGPIFMCSNRNATVTFTWPSTKQHGVFLIPSDV